MEFKDYYEVMGLKRDATQDEVKRAYRKLARKYHPDVSKEADAEARFKELGEAYEVLKDPEKRVAYNQLGANWKNGQDFRPPPDWDQGFEFHGGDFTGADANEFSDFFESLFGRNGSRQAGAGHAQRGFNSRGQDTHAKIEIDLEDSYRGASRGIKLKHTELGSDGRPYLKERTLKVSIPKGVCQGQYIRLGKQGGPGIGKSEAGDLFLQIEFRPHSFYHVEGKDVYFDLPVAPWEAALGASINVPTPSGAVELKIPANSSGGKKLRLKGRGIPAKSPGDLYVVLRIVLPPADNEVARKLYRDLEQKLKFNPRAGMGV
jgi:curved DNA-binding protein